MNERKIGRQKDMKNQIMFILGLFLALSSNAQQVDDFILTRKEEIKYVLGIDSVFKQRSEKGEIWVFSKKLKDDYCIPVLSDTLPDGNWTIYYQNGQKALELTILNGLKNGNLNRYWANGNLRYAADFSNNELSGEENWYSFEGNLTLKIVYFKGQEHLRISYYENGKKSIMQKYVNNRETGTILYWDENGRPLTPMEFWRYEKVLKDR